MKNVRTTWKRKGSAPGGFTLVELLVVMAIIAVLGALVASGVMGWIGGQSRRNTETQIRFLYNAVMQHQEFIINSARKESIPAAVTTFADNSSDRARLIWIKIRLMEAFPVRYSEIQTAYQNAPLSYIPATRRLYMGNYAALLNGRTPAQVALKQAKCESAACLYMALSLDRGGIGWNKDTLSTYSRDTDGDGIPEFIDGWNEPLYFYRFGTGNTDMQGLKPPGMPSQCYDPLDPRGVLRTWSGGYSGSFDTTVHPRLNGADAWYAVPAIVSSGPNMKLGLAANASAPYSDMTIVTPIDQDDNVCSYKLK